MTAKEFLRQYDNADRKAKRIRLEYEEECIKIDAVRSVSDNDGMPHGSGISKPTEDKAIRIADKAIALADAELEALRIRQEVFEVINQVEGVDGDILFHRYVRLRPWKEVCEAVFMSWYGVRYHHAAGLERVQQIIDRKNSNNIIHP